MWKFGAAIYFSFRATRSYTSSTNNCAIKPSLHLGRLLCFCCGCASKHDIRPLILFSQRCAGLLLCIEPDDGAVVGNTSQIYFHFGWPKNNDVVAPLLLFYWYWCPHDLNTSPLHRRVDCYICEVLLQQHQLHPPLEHISCAQVGGGASLVHSHQAISMVQMAKSAVARRSPAAADVADDVGWL